MTSYPPALHRNFAEDQTAGNTKKMRSKNPVLSDHRIRGHERRNDVYMGRPCVEVRSISHLTIQGALVYRQRGGRIHSPPSESGLLHLVESNLVEESVVRIRSVYLSLKLALRTKTQAQLG